MFWDCKDCVFGTNSKKQAAAHISETGHEVNPEKENDVAFNPTYQRQAWHGTAFEAEED